MTSTIERKEKKVIELTITIPKEEINKTYEKFVDDMVTTAEVEGFRKGKAPRSLIEGRINKAKFNEEILRELLPHAYTEAVKEHKITPIVNPQIELVSMEEGKDWTFKATTCEEPEVKLGDYKDRIKTLTAKSKIAIPGKEQQTVHPDEIFKALLEGTTIDIPEFVVAQEVDRLLSHLVNDIKSLGLSLEQYMQTVKKTPESLRDEYRKQAENDLKLEFILEKIANDEKISIEPKEIEEAIKAIKNDDERAQVAQNPYYLAQILRRQKTLDFIRNL